MMLRPTQLIALCLVASSLIACTQMVEESTPALPVTIDPSLDPGILTGQLHNGFRYYLRSTNSAPQNDQLEVRLVVKAGSLHEAPGQHGYAHLLEHMAYRGTSSFPTQKIELLLAENGLRWGEHVNATTHYGATVYRFSLNQKDTDLLPGILALMAEWLSTMKIDPVALEKEKRIVEAEWRERYADRNFVIEPVVASAYAGSVYANRHPAGDLENIQSVTVKDLQKFWKSHYRADNVALVITGDARPWQLEPLIEEAFAGLAASAQPSSAQPVEPKVGNNRPGVMFFKGGAMVELQSYSNPMLELPQLSINFISAMPESVNSASASQSVIENRFRNELLFNVYSHLLRSRIANTQECSSIVLEASVLESGQSVEQVNIALAEKDLLLCLSVAVDAVAETAKTKLTDEEFFQFTKLFKEAARTSIDRYRVRNAAAHAGGLVDMVTRGEYVLSAWSMQSIINKVVDEFDRPTLNSLIGDIGESHRLVYSLATNQPNPPSMSEVISAAGSKGTGLSIRPGSSVVYGSLKSDQDNLFIPHNTRNGADKSASKASVLQPVSKHVSSENYHEWQLASGASVVLIPDERFEHVAVSAVSHGGYAHQSGIAAKAARSLPAFLSVNGMDGYTSRSLRNIMNDKQLIVEPFVSPFHHGINASGSVADLPALLTMVGGYFEEPLVVEPQSTSFLQQLGLKNTGPQWYSALRQESEPMRMVDNSKLSNESFIQVHRELFSSTADFAFIFVGSVDPDTLESQLHKLTAGTSQRQPGSGARVNASDSQAENAFVINHGAGNTEMSLFLSCSDGASNSRMEGNKWYEWQLLSDILAERLRYSLREEHGLVYEVGSKIPASGQLIHQISFSVAPEDEALVSSTVQDVLAEISQSGIRETELASALARENRSARKRSGDYQFIASDKAHQWLFNSGALQLDNSDVTVDGINSMARCISTSTRQVMLDSYESFLANIPADDSARQRSTYRRSVYQR